MCTDEECKCQADHENCEIFKFESLIRKIEEKKKPLSSEVKSVFATIDKIYDDAIERVSQEK